MTRVIAADKRVMYSTCGWSLDHERVYREALENKSDLETEGYIQSI
jgi:hypothetical protein